MNSTHNISHMIPTDYNEALNSAKNKECKLAIKDKLASMDKEHMFLTIFISASRKEVPQERILSTKCVFVKKSKPEQYKARLVARGFRRIHGINLDETFAPTPTFNALRLLFLTTNLMKWKIKKFDVKVAFLHSFIDKPVFVWPLRGLEVPMHHILKLNKALYGTKQAAWCW
ncbi:hypothetical protein O181_067514 [Austropuccinia psidii MF-1]|uniref:Reverse transcriptase Ty1/copia-type domain-containing protein n=1 Tax=Austropuccinia psidii MF-1 TaxID=1389203 RepID=A0A9Q3I6L9_9BASI|nr:hypothetical protein [Austropuccinia psidii MF-1]